MMRKIITIPFYTTAITCISILRPETEESGELVITLSKDIEYSESELLKKEASKEEKPIIFLEVRKKSFNDLKSKIILPEDKQMVTREMIISSFKPIKSSKTRQ